VSSAILTAPNVISFVRILLMPLCAWLLATGRFAPGFLLTAIVGTTDWVDGWLARRTNSVSRLGQLLDPLADRLLIGSVAIALVVRGALPWPALIALLGRDLLLLVGFRMLENRGIRPPDVIWLGKLATFVLLVALPSLALGETSASVAPAFKVFGLVALWAGVVLYWVTGLRYLRIGLDALRAHRQPQG
jgi:cardiolipin synthase